MSIHICPGPSERTVTDRVEAKWCFGCRKRQPHTWVVWSDPFPSYYEPVGAWECPVHKRDITTFGAGA